MNFCKADYARVCAIPTLDYAVCYQCDLLVRGDPCEPTLCCDHENQITPKASIPDQEYEINPELPYPGQYQTVDIRNIFWDYANYAVCENDFEYSMLEVDSNNIVSISSAS